MSEQGSYQPFDGEQAAVEALIRASRDYVRPSDELRPRVLDAAREHCSDCRAERRLGSFALVVLLLVMTTPIVLRSVSNFQAGHSAVTATKIESLAAELAARQDVGTHWALAEAVTRWRSLQSSRLGQAELRMK